MLFLPLQQRILALWRTFFLIFIKLKIVFCKLFRRVLNLSFRKGLTFYQTRNFYPFPPKSPGFFRVCSTILLKTLWIKEKLLVTSNFSFLPQFFLHVSSFHQVWNCRLQTLSVWKFSQFFFFLLVSRTFIKFEIVIYKRCRLRRVYNLSFGKELKSFKFKAIADDKWKMPQITRFG